jgi:hypothetical protein
MANTKKTRNKSVPKNETKPKKIVSNQINPLVANSSRDSIWFDLHSSKWLTSVKTTNFTNFLFDIEEFTKNHFYVFYTIVPKVIDEWKRILAGGHAYQHCHLLNGVQRSIVEDVFKEIYRYKLGEGVEIRQFGFTGSVRLVCIHNDINSCLIPIFIDHHHLIYPNKHFNAKDFDKFKYCSICQLS